MFMFDCMFSKKNINSKKTNKKLTMVYELWSLDCPLNCLPLKKKHFWITHFHPKCGQLAILTREACCATLCLCNMLPSFRERQLTRNSIPHCIQMRLCPYLWLWWAMAPRIDAMCGLSSNEMSIKFLIKQTSLTKEWSYCACNWFALNDKAVSKVGLSIYFGTDVNIITMVNTSKTIIFPSVVGADLGNVIW